MNPMLRWASAIHDMKTPQVQEKMQRKRDAQRIKLRQEKEKRRLDAIERENKRRLNQEVPGEREDESKNEESAACKFQKELGWCVHQLELGLVNMKPDAQQAKEAERLLKVLKSSKAPMARKRQIMRSSFGDYRAKMQREERKHSEAMQQSTALTPVESEQLSTATFYRRATSSSISSQRSQSAVPKLVNIQPVIPETDREGTEEEKEDQRENEKKDEDAARKEDTLMRSLELETMDMHLCKSGESADRDCMKNVAGIGRAIQSTDTAGDHSNVTREMRKEEEQEQEECEKENIQSRTPTEDDDTSLSQISSAFSSSASLFSFNFEIKEEDLDVMDGNRTNTSTNIGTLKGEGLESHLLLRGVDNRASDSTTSSSSGASPKKSGRRRPRGKKKQQRPNQENQNREKGSGLSPKEALLSGSSKIEVAAREGFKFDFPDPVEMAKI